MKPIVAVLSGALLLLAGILLGQSVNRGVRFVNASGLSTPPGYSHAAVIERGRIVYLAGQVGLDASGKFPGDGGFRAQAVQAFENLRSVLAAAGAKPADIVKLNYYVVGIDREKLTALRQIRDGFIDRTHPPASTLAGVQSLFREDCQIEIEAVAAIP